MSKLDLVYIKASEIKPEELKIYISSIVGSISQKSIYNDLSDLSDSYPDFKSWYENKVIKEISEGNKQREIIIALENNEEIVGISILKKTKEEKKICTFRIHEDYRNQGVGKSLFEESFKYLETRKPIITISENRKKMFEPLIKYYNFELVQKLPNYYKEDVVEFVYNGKIVNEL